MKRTIVYIDGYNLYYGLLRGTSNKWLDPVAFAKALLAEDHDIIAVKYFTSRVNYNPREASKIEYIRHRGKKQVLVFNPHLKMSGHLKKVSTYYKDIPRELPAACQLPETFTYGTHDRIIRRPAAWK